jgi:hypothetical protein
MGNKSKFKKIKNRKNKKRTKKMKGGAHLQDMTNSPTGASAYVPENNLDPRGLGNLNITEHELRELLGLPPDGANAGGAAQGAGGNVYVPVGGGGGGGGGNVYVPVGGGGGGGGGGPATDAVTAFGIMDRAITNIVADPNDPAPRAVLALQLGGVCGRAHAGNQDDVRLLTVTLDSINQLCRVIPDMYDDIIVGVPGRAEGSSKVVTWGNIPRAYKFQTRAMINAGLFNPKRPLPFNAPAKRIVAMAENVEDAMYTRFLSALLPGEILSMFDPDARNAQPGRLPPQEIVEGQAIRVFVQPKTQPIIAGDPLLVPTIIRTVDGLLDSIPGVCVGYLDGKIANFGKLCFQGPQPDSIVCIDAGTTMCYAIPPAYREYFRRAALTVAFCSIGNVSAAQLQQITAVISIAQMEEVIQFDLTPENEQEIRNYARNFFRTLGLNETAVHTRVILPFTALTHYCRDYYEPSISHIPCGPGDRLRRFRRKALNVGLIPALPGPP